MSNSSNTPSQVISLPKGGGALKGIGEKFSPDLHTGTGNFTVPIALPPGRNGFQPQLNLVYSTGNGNGPFGLGWNLSIPGVSRQTAKGIPRYRDAEDVFILSGAEDLVPVSGDFPGKVQYRPRTEGLFAHILRHLDTSNDYWQVQSKDGLVSLYGTPAARSNDPDTIIDPAVIAEPHRSDKVFTWKLTETCDPFGNKIVYDYVRDRATERSRDWDQLYLRRIRYADYEDNQGAQRFLVSVEFLYDDDPAPPNTAPVTPTKARPDPFSDYRSGFEIRTRKRCKWIVVRTHSDKAKPVRAYELVYLDERQEIADQLPLNNGSLLSQVHVIGYDDSAQSARELPPLEFGYSQFEPQKRDFFPLQGRDLPPRSLANPDLELVDLFGNGLPDILEMNGTVRYWRNLGNGKFDLPHSMRDAPAGLALADSGVQLIDADGDGRTDLLVTTPGLSGYFPLRFGGLWDRRSFQKYALAPSFNLEDPEVRLVDLDGDGVTDAIRSGTRLECFFNDQHDGWTSDNTRWVERKALEVFPNVNFSNPRVKWADMSGDGLQDIVLAYGGNIEYWPNLGHGNWGKRIHMKNSPTFPYDYDPKRILIGDVDGDGLADIVYVDDRKVTLWINQSGNGWSGPITIQGTPPVSDMDAVRLADMLGAGISGVLWSTDANGFSHANMFFLDFTGGTKPYVLNEMDNHMGAVTKVKYLPSTQFYLQDQKQLKTQWKTPLPFPVQVVACVEVIDAISGGKLTTEYKYHHGYWDGAEREFRGFGMVEQCDTEIFDAYNKPGLHGSEAFFEKIINKAQFSPPTLTKTWFHQGPIGDEFGEWEEQDWSDEYWSGDSQVLKHAETTNNFLKSIQRRRVKRDVLRTLRGSILRTELYAIDSSNREDRPYTVTEHVYGLREESPPGVNDEDRLHIFFPHTLAQRTTQWERGGEPMMQFSFTGNYDKYGQPQSQISIAVPRNRRYLESIPAGARAPENYLATHTLTDYAQRDDAVYIVDRVARTTTYEIPNDGRDDLFGLKSKIENKSLDSQINIIGQTLNFYDRGASQSNSGAFFGLPFGQIGDYGALVRTENLVLTEDILHKAYKRGDAVLNAAEEPPYLARNGTPAWTAEYPQEFQNLLSKMAGYTFHSGGQPDSIDARGFFVATERRRYDFHDDPNGKGQGLITAKREPLGRDTTITYDAPFHLLPKAVTDPAGLTTKAEYDYRVLQPSEVTDPNGNVTRFSYTQLGLVKETWIRGNPIKNEGDRLRPSAKVEYDFLAFANRGQPVFVRTIRQVHHDSETDVPLPKRDETIATVEYSDGFGRLLQTRSQGEEVRFGDSTFGGGDKVLPAKQSDGAGNAVVGTENTNDAHPNVVVSGWQIYDNKGRVVEKYEPFFDIGWDYDPPEDFQLGQKATMFYDPRGQVIRTVNPDGSEQRVIYGVPKALDDPPLNSLDSDKFLPTPWEAYTYDANDLAPVSFDPKVTLADGSAMPLTDGAPRHHYFTPSNMLIDALGRTVLATERNRATPANPTDPLPPIEEYRNSSTYDIRGNLLTVTDALGRVAFKHVYDLANRPLRIESIDAGIRRSLLDANGNEIERRDSKGVLILRSYDMLNRPIRLWARNGTGQPMTLRERLIYGDSQGSGLTSNQAAAANLLDKPYKHYDEAGLLTFAAFNQSGNLTAAYDFNGNLLEKQREVIADSAIASALNSGTGPSKTVVVNWNSPPPLEGRYQTSMSYDALNRIKSMQYPRDVDGSRKTLNPTYNRAGALERINLDGATYVERIAYNAKGQRTLIAYGNKVMTRYAYDERTFRLARLRTERHTNSGPLTYTPGGATLQDFAYEYDLAGNITKIHDRSPESGILNTPLGSDALDRVFTYDPLHRLLSATGREGDAPPPIPPNKPWYDAPLSTDLTLARKYTESYEYDSVGNMTRLGHTHFLANGSALGNKREFEFVADTNRLKTVTVGTLPYAYIYDDNGNLIRENTERHLAWDHADRLIGFANRATQTSPASKEACYLYDAAGQRVKKYVRNQQGQVEVTIYIDGTFEHHIRNSGANNTLHVMDNQSRIVMVRVGNAFSDDGAPNVRVKYYLGDHLGSSNMVVGGSTATASTFINREEYTPYGETSFGRFARKRYRFTGKERDEETGLYYHGARYYAPWLARWVSCDPGGRADGLNSYPYVRNNPVRFTDTTGAQASDVAKIHAESDFEPMVITPDRVSGANSSSVFSQESRPENLGEFLDLGKHRWDIQLHLLRKEGIQVQRIDNHKTWDELQRLEIENIEAMTWEGFLGSIGTLSGVGRASYNMPKASLAHYGANKSVVSAAARSSLPKSVRDWWYKGAENDAAWRELSFGKKVLHEIGKKSVPNPTFAKLSEFTHNSVEMGKELTKKGTLGAALGIHPIKILQNLGSGPTSAVRAAGELISESADVAISQSVQRSGVAAYIALIHSDNLNMSHQREDMVDERSAP